MFTCLQLYRCSFHEEIVSFFVLHLLRNPWDAFRSVEYDKDDVACISEPSVLHDFIYLPLAH